MSRFSYFTLFSLFLIFQLSSCTKYFNEVTLSIDKEGTITTTNNTPVEISYEVTGENIDSISLLVNNILLESHLSPQSEFIYIPRNTHPHHVEIKVFHDGGLNITKSFDIHCNYYHQPDIWYDIFHIDGEEDYFLGEQLLIKPILKNHNYDISDCKQMELFVNQQSVGIDKEPPFEFKTIPCVEPYTKLTLKYIDADGAERTYESTIHLREDYQPNILLWITDEFQYLREGILFDKSIKLDVYSSDNVGLEKLEVYIDNTIVETFISNELSYENEFWIRNLSKGDHEIYVKCYAQRNQIAFSDTLHIQVQDYLKTEGYYDVITAVAAQNDSLVYYLNEHQLHILNHQTKAFKKIINLYYTAVDMAYNPIEQKIYIANTNNYLSVINETTYQSEGHLELDFLTSMDKVVCDHSGNLLIQSNSKIYYYKPSTGIHYELDMELGYEPIIKYNEKTDEFIIFNNYAHQYMFYRIKLTNDSFEIIQEMAVNKTHNAFQINPVDNTLILRNSHNYWDVFSLDPLGTLLESVEFENTWNLYFNKDYSKLIYPFTEGIAIHSSSDYQLDAIYSILQIGGFSNSIAVATNDPNKWVIIVNEFLDDTSKVLFFEEP